MGDLEYLNDIKRFLFTIYVIHCWTLNVLLYCGFCHSFLHSIARERERERDRANNVCIFNQQVPIFRIHLLCNMDLVIYDYYSWIAVIYQFNTESKYWIYRIVGIVSFEMQKVENATCRQTIRRFPYLCISDKLWLVFANQYSVLI